MIGIYILTAVVGIALEIIVLYFFFRIANDVRKISRNLDNVKLLSKEVFLIKENLHVKSLQDYIKLSLMYAKADDIKKAKENLCFAEFIAQNDDTIEIKEKQNAMLQISQIKDIMSSPKN